jgi:hypothetical protein
MLPAIRQGFGCRFTASLQPQSCAQSVTKPLFVAENELGETLDDSPILNQSSLPMLLIDES